MLGKKATADNLQIGPILTLIGMIDLHKAKLRDNSILSLSPVAIQRFEKSILVNASINIIFFIYTYLYFQFILISAVLYCDIFFVGVRLSDARA